ncbi:UNVERIFIED_CONTAM: hypothetical protein NCL1_18224 [Trichonephila clavipes]
MSFTRRSCSGRPQQTNRRDGHRIIRNAMRRANCFIPPIQAQVVCILWAHVSSRTILRCLVEGHLVSQRLLRVLPLTPTHRRFRLEYSRTRGIWTAAVWNQIVFSDESKTQSRQ